MGELPLQTTEGAARVPVPREPPPPPGYIDPLDGSGALDDLVPANHPSDLPSDLASDLPSDLSDDEDDQPPTRPNQRSPGTT